MAPGPDGDGRAGSAEVQEHRPRLRAPRVLTAGQRLREEGRGALPAGGGQAGGAGVSHHDRVGRRFRAVYDW